MSRYSTDRGRQPLPESDSAFRHYVLRVPPKPTKTALEAVAWTFDMQTAEYARLKAET